MRRNYIHHQPKRRLHPRLVVLAKALGEKADTNEIHADTIGLIRIIIFLSYMTTNMFIVAGVIRHWNK